jgi:hypothetical protein
MKKSTIVIIVIAVILIAVIGAMIMRKPTAPKDETNLNPLSGNNQPANDAVTQLDVNSADSTANGIDTSSFSDTALDDLG